MYIKRPRSSNASDHTSGEERRTCAPVRTTSALFRPGVKIMVARAPLLSGLGVGLQKKFQRPMLKRRAYGTQQDVALRNASLGQRKRFGGLANILARAGKPLTAPPVAKQITDANVDSDEEEDEDEQEEDRPFEPLILWQSPHQGGDAVGLPPQIVHKMVADEYGVESEMQVSEPAPLTAYARGNVEVPAVLAKWLRPHQREGVQFMYECVMGLKGFRGNGCILADDMGLGKTLQSVSLIYTLLKTGITADGQPTAKRVIVVCPCSLVKNWENEFVKWLGPETVKTMALAEADRKKIERDIDSFCKTRIKQVLIASYECVRTHIKRFTKYPDCCDLFVADESQRLKNMENQTFRALNSLPVKRRVLLTGTPMQNDLTEFYSMVEFTNPLILGTPEQFRRNMLFPILRGREPDATEAQKAKMLKIQQDMSNNVNRFILRRVNTLNAQHLPPKLVQVVCCNLTDIQQDMYQHLVNSKDLQHAINGKQVNCLGSIQTLMKLCNHPSLVVEQEDKGLGGARNGKRTAKTGMSYADDEEKESTAAPGAAELGKFLPHAIAGGRKGDFAPVFPEWSGKMYVLYRLMKEMRKPGNGNDKIVIVSNYTQTLDLIGRMCRENSWGFCRLDGSINMKKRQKMVDEFNNPSSLLIAFLLSSKAGGCGLNLIGGNRLVLFDPDWNPAVDKQAAARCWRDGQKKRCFTYRFMATGTVEEKIFQRQLSKEGLQSVVDDKEQINALSTKDLKNLFKLRTGTPSDTHDKLRCQRCEIIHDNAELEAKKVLPKKLKACGELLEEIVQHEDADHFLNPLDPTEYGVSKEDYEKKVKQPMDFATIRSKLEKPADHAQAYANVAGFSKDVNRIFSNVLKIWDQGDESIADAAGRLQVWWMDKWQVLVHKLMRMKPDEEEDDTEADKAETAVDDVLAGCANFNNERGDDYQEQIGMPDEENMRHWSHHYSTDTVDDPVFRAAMRGSDAVSFVFGLEVTWSLIQERQEQEEADHAAEELQAQEELADLLGDEEEDSKAAAINKCCDHGANDAQQDLSMDTAVDDDDHDDDDDSVAAGPDDENEMKDFMVDDDEDEAGDGEKDFVAEDEDVEEEEVDNVEAKAVEESRHASAKAEPAADDLDEEPVDVAMAVDDEDDAQEEPIAEAVDSPEAAVVELPTPTTASTESTIEEPVSVDKRAPIKSTMDSLASIGKENASKQPLPPNGEWNCQSCTYLNKKSARKCEMCYQPKKKRNFEEVSL